MVKTYACQCCGKTYIKNLNPDVYLERNCFECSFWLLKTEYYEDLTDRRVVVDGNHYMISAVTDTYPKGFGGRQFIIQFFDGRIIKTNNLWSQGSIPDRFREMLPDNAVFLSTEDQPSTTSSYSGNIFNEGGKHV
nr:hypothetical protein [uncultured Desulfobacter sp.]